MQIYGIRVITGSSVGREYVVNLRHSVGPYHHCSSGFRINARESHIQAPLTVMPWESIRRGDKYAEIRPYARIHSAFQPDPHYFEACSLRADLLLDLAELGIVPSQQASRACHRNAH